MIQFLSLAVVFFFFSIIPLCLVIGFCYLFYHYLLSPMLHKHRGIESKQDKFYSDISKIADSLKEKKD